MEDLSNVAVGRWANRDRVLDLVVGTKVVGIRLVDQGTDAVAEHQLARANSADARVENTVWVAPGQTIDVEVRMNAPGKGAWIFHCHVLSHVMGPDGKSLELAKANGGMIIPVVYTDSENIGDLSKAL